MADYTNNHNHVEEEIPEGIHVDGIGDTHPEGGEKVPLMKNGEPYPAHIVPEDLEHNPDYSGTEDDDSYEEYEEDWDWDDDDDDDEGEEEATATESGSPHDRFSNFAGVSAALFSDVFCSVLSKENIRELKFGTHFGDVGAFLSIKIER